MFKPLYTTTPLVINTKSYKLPTRRLYTPNSMQQTTHNKAAENMLSFSPTPIFSGNWDHRPVVSSPLSSSPARASSPLSPIDRDAYSQRQIQSSPIKPLKFKFASRPSRPNPLNRKREEVQDSRRKQFLQNVKQSREDKVWQRRDIEGQFLKTNYLADKGQLSHDAPEVTEADIEEAMTFHQEYPLIPEQDEMMMDEEEQFEAMLASYEEQQMASSQRPPSPTLSEEGYDDVFAELIAQEQAQHNTPIQPPPDQMDTSGDIEMQ
ncbi:hypothetical protein FLONG3_11207 [Fusarium longipes]|uniref:Uncharacterized protein n=1 Tax=Fusarium longipes TaxID=694270 RepID=A0A395RH92_9HYPO|nr:hypothetical protein FLONG3_11207 [Fusarium longipes]